MLTVHHLSKAFDSQILFEHVSFHINPGERLGLVGPNGCGKTSLVRILAGLDAPSEGQVTRDPQLRLGYLAQGFEPDPALSVGEIIGQAAGDAAALEDELGQAAEALTAWVQRAHPSAAEAAREAEMTARYDHLLQRIEACESGRTASILAGLGLDTVDPHLPAARLSGGQKTRLALGLVLLGEPQLLLLDEPTNHLDIEMLEWLEDWLRASPCGALIISHDRAFLDHSVSRILEMDPLKRRVREYTGNYSAYLEQRQAEIERQWSAYHDQQLEIQQMEQDIARVKAQAAYTERQASSIRIGGPDMKNKGFKSYQQGIAKKVAKKAKSREKKLERYLEDDERVERPAREREVKFAFGEAPHLGRGVIWLENLSVGYDPAHPLLEGLNLQVAAGRHIAISGPNGSGKTTLLRCLAGQQAPLAGSVQLGSSVRLGWMDQEQTGLDLTRSGLESALAFFHNQTEARGFLSRFNLTEDEPLKPVGLLSYGQRSLLHLALLVAQECNCLLLDEPMNHLDIASRMQFEQALGQFQGAVLAVSHDRYFMERFAEEVWVVEKKGIRTTYPPGPLS